MTEKSFGRSAGFLSVGKVINRKDDPTQTGQCKVQWQMGGSTQSDMKEDDLPWSPTLFNPTNPSLGNRGGPHTGLLEGSQVIGMPMGADGQDFIILGSYVKAGKGEPDGQPEYDSDIPVPAKSESTGGENQPESGDKNKIVTEKSITKFAQDEGGPDKKAADYADIEEPIGTLDQKIEE